jgi:hypothetical protein
MDVLNRRTGMAKKSTLTKAAQAVKSVASSAADAAASTAGAVVELVADAARKGSRKLERSRRALDSLTAKTNAKKKVPSQRRAAPGVARRRAAAKARRARALARKKKQG